MHAPETNATQLSAHLQGARSRNKAPPEFKEKVLQVLKDNDFEERRSAKCTQEDLLHLLACFNAADIHFA